MIDKLINKLTEEINKHFQEWMFVGSIVDLYYLRSKPIIIKDYDIVTLDPFEPNYTSNIFGPRYSFKAMGRTVDVFVGEPTGRFETIEQRLVKLQWLIEINPAKREKYEQLIQWYNEPLTPQVKVKQTKQVKQLPVCQYLGEQVETMICNVCGEGKGSIKPVFSCSLHGKCTPRQVRHAQKGLYGIHVCLGCDEGPKSFK